MASSDPLEDEACLTSKNPAKLRPATLLFQLDVSGSMNCSATDTASASCVASGGSRWAVFTEQLKDALAEMPDQNRAGLMHYPTSKGTFSGQPTGCVPQAPDVMIAPLSTSRAQIGSALDGRTPEGGTPTHDAVSVALAQLQATSADDGNRFLVLATDGNGTFCKGCDISCNVAALAADSDAMVAEVAEAKSEGILTFVIGVPGSQNFREILSRLAEAGGTAISSSCSNTGPSYCHYDMTTATDFGAALQAALAAIGGETLSCSYDIPKEDGSFDPTLVNVRITSDGTTRNIKRDASHADGWDYSPDGSQILLYGEACSSAQRTINGAVTILYGCPTVTVI